MHTYIHTHTYIFVCIYIISRSFPGGAVVKNPPASAGNARYVGLIPGSGRSPGRGNGNPFQYFCQENFMDGGSWWATVHRIAKGSDMTDH